MTNELVNAFTDAGFNVVATSTALMGSIVRNAMYGMVEVRDLGDRFEVNVVNMRGHVAFFIRASRMALVQRVLHTLDNMGGMRDERTVGR